MTTYCTSTSQCNLQDFVHYWPLKTTGILTDL